MADIVSDNFKHLLQPDTVLPMQYFATLRRKGAHEPERRLVIAVLQDAVDCFQKHLLSRDRKAHQLFKDAEQWICSSDRSWPFAFENVCDLLQINSEYLRSGLLTWKERELEARSERGCAKVVVLKPSVPAPTPRPTQLRKAQAR